MILSAVLRLSEDRRGLNVLICGFFLNMLFVQDVMLPDDGCDYFSKDNTGIIIDVAIEECCSRRDSLNAYGVIRSNLISASDERSSCDETALAPLPSFLHLILVMGNDTVAVPMAKSLTSSSKWFNLYGDFISKNASAVSQIESGLRSLTYIIPGIVCWPSFKALMTDATSRTI